MKSKVLLSGLCSIAVLGLTACGGGSSDLGEKPVEDNKAPVFDTIIEDKIIEVGDTYTDDEVTATDNVDPSVEVITSGTVDADTAGTYTLTYEATDLAGNVAKQTREVRVVQKTEFNEYNGTWTVDCAEVDSGNTKLLGYGVSYLNKTVAIYNRNVRLRARGFSNSSCTGAPVLKGTAEARVFYTGKILSDTFTGEKVDMILENAHYSRANDNVIEVPENKLENYAELMGLMTYDILAKRSPNELLSGLPTSVTDGSSNVKRPVEFNLEDYLYKSAE